MNNVSQKQGSILSIANSIARNHAAPSQKAKSTHATAVNTLSHQPLGQDQQTEEMESIASFGEYEPLTEPDRDANRATQDWAVSEDQAPHWHTSDDRADGRSMTNASQVHDEMPQVYVETQYDSACLFTEDGSYPGFDVYTDADC